MNFQVLIVNDYANYSFNENYEGILIFVVVDRGLEEFVHLLQIPSYPRLI